MCVGSSQKPWSTAWLLLFLAAMAGCGKQDPEKPAAQAASEITGPPRDPGMTGVTDTWGPLIVREGEFYAEAKVKPWSSWWYPVRYPWLFQQRGEELATLQKYDLFVRRAKGVDSSAASYEEKHIFNPDADSWEGLCDAWSTAAVLEPEPAQPVTVEGIHFSVGDLKALLIKTYENAEGKRHFGQRYNGDRGSVYDDIYPDQFHRFLQHELFENGRMFVADVDPGIAVWNAPFWKALVRVRRDDNHPDVLHVEATLQAASSDVRTYDFVGTKEVTYIYTYDLLANELPDGSFRVVYGEWTGDSLRLHPDFVTYFDQKVTRASRNVEIKPEFVDLILGRSRDPS